MDSEQLQRKCIGELPILQHMAQRLGFENVLRAYIPAHGNKKVPAVQTLMLLLFNLTSGQQPLYELADWTSQMDGRLLGYDSEVSEELLNDDRFGRALDKLYDADRASLMTDLVLGVVRSLKLDLSQVHNDSINWSNSIESTISTIFKSGASTRTFASRSVKDAPASTRVIASAFARFIRWPGAVTEAHLNKNSVWMASFRFYAPIVASAQKRHC